MERIIEDITNYIFVSDKPEVSDAIFLPGGTFCEVPEGGARLFGEGYAPLVLPSGRFSVKAGLFTGVSTGGDTYGGSYVTECEFYRDVLLRGGVPDGNILCEDRAASTRDNALFTRALTDSSDIHIGSAIICCKAFHARRCLMYYQMAYPETKITVCPVHCCGIYRDNWYKSADGINTVLGELAKCGWQMNELLKEHMKIS